ncbi:MAG: hypothetical protein K2U26_13415, partial [Cyclobacteriaceae bacterium]|nr:hypothetical protein [Cyclobacteriaceae bacterium]
MSYIIRVLKRVLVDEFYRTHAGLFLIVLGICFGFMSGNEHMALAQFFTGSPLLALIPIAGWLLYAIIIVSFNRIELTKPENNFLLTLVELSPGMRWFALISTSAQAFLPAALYGLFLIKIAFSVRQFSSIVVIVAGCVALILLIALDLHHNLLRPGRERKTGLLKRITNRYVTKPFAWFYPEWITRAQPLMVFGTKLFSCLIIAGVGILYHYDTYDQRFFQMACVLAISANMVLVYHYHRFENVHLIMLRSLP